MQGSVNNWEKDGKKNALKGQRRSRNELKPTGHIEEGLKNTEIDRTDSDSSVIRVLGQHVKKVMSKVNSNWILAVPSFAVAQVRPLIKKLSKKKIF
jgi:hypothetical protein